MWGWKGWNSAVLHAQLWAADGLITLFSTHMRTRFQWNRVPWWNSCLSDSLSMMRLHMSAWLCLSFHYNTNWQPCEFMKWEQCQQHLCIILKFSMLINLSHPYTMSLGLFINTTGRWYFNLVKYFVVISAVNESVTFHLWTSLPDGI